MDSDEEFSEYFKANEPPEHRRLRKLFLRRYAGKISQDELECLSQVLVNIEFLGCRYPKETMLRIEAMCSDILKEFGSKNLRTLVSADSAIQDRNATKYRRTTVNTGNAKSGIEFVPETSVPPVREELSVNASSLHRKFYNLLSSVVGFKLIQDDQEVKKINHCNSITKTIQAHKGGKFEEIIGPNKFECRYNGQLLIKVEGHNAKATGYEKTYTLLKNYCPFLVRVATHFSKNEQVIQKKETFKNTLTSSEVQTFDDKKIGADNIGYRMLKALGWEENKIPENGILDPIGLSVKIGRSGLGSTKEPKTSLDMGYFKNIMTNYKNSGSEFDLVFSSEFTKAERATLHIIAQKLLLKSKSIGSKDGRFLVIGRKQLLTPWQLVNKVRSKDPFYSAVWAVESPDLKELHKLDLA